MIQEYQVRVLPQIAANEQRLKEFLQEEKGINPNEVNAVRILKRNIDARQRTVYFNLTVRVFINEIPHDEEFTKIDYLKVGDKPQVIVVGAGPGGYLSALRLIELGFCPIVFERGKTGRAHV